MDIHFLFIGEGSSDEALVTHLEDVCILAGANEVSGIAPDLGRLGRRIGHDVSSKVEAALSLEPTANLLFVHRDADSRDPEPRYREIERAIQQLDVKVPHVSVVPVQEIEAWLLLEEAEIRRVAENPNGRVALNLPSPNTVENITNPKERLREALLTASETTGRRRQRFVSRFDDHRRLLIERLHASGRLSTVAAWRRLFADVEAAITRVRQSGHG